MSELRNEAAVVGKSQPGGPVADVSVDGPRPENAPQETDPPTSEPMPAAELASKAPRPELERVQAEARRQLELLWAHAREPSSPPASGKPLDEFVWGLAQPLLGLRTLASHGDLFIRGVVPALLFILVCALVVDGSEVEGPWGLLGAYYGVLVGAASISPVLFCRNYAKLAAEARRHLEVPRHEPYLRSYWQAFVEAITQALVLGIGVAPWAGLIRHLPLLGSVWAAVIGWLWVVHWIVVEALDSARTLPPAQTPETLEQRHAMLDPPWYSGAALSKLRAPLGSLLLPLRWWGSIMARLGRRWRGEVAVIEARPWLALGFGAGASVLLVVPVLNLLFRPALVVAASHVLGRLEPELSKPDTPTKPGLAASKTNEASATLEAQDSLALPSAAE